jgi:excisionase family DNA binding protein
MEEQAQRETLPGGLVRVDKAASWLGISRAGVYRLLDDGQLKGIRIGTARLIPRGEIIEFADRKIREGLSND